LGSHRPVEEKLRLLEGVARKDFRLARALAFVAEHGDSAQAEEESLELLDAGGAL
jgi:hypothetical protein